MYNNMKDVCEMELVKAYMQKFPKEYNAIYNLALYDKKVKHHIDTHYDPDEIFNLIKTVEYYKELDNVENGIYKQTPFSLYAQKRMILFKSMTNATYNYSLKYGKEKAYKMIDIISKYITEKVDIDNVIV